MDNSQNRMREIRKARGITQMQLAGMTGILQSAISRMERYPSLDNIYAAALRKVAVALDCSIEELMGY